MRRKAAAADPVKSIKFTAAEIVMRKVDELKPFPNNPKIHTPAQLDAIAANIREFGFDQPVLIDETDTILKGHGRSLAAPKAGRDEVPTIVREGLSPAQKWAIVISDNALPAMTGFDRKLLTTGLTQLAKWDYPLHLTGFDKVRLATFIGVTPGAGNPDDEPELQPATSKRGDVWLLGDHRLICGDSSNKKTVELICDDDDPALMAADPPYKFESVGGGIYPQKVPHARRAKEANVSDFEVSQLCELRDTNVIFTSKELLADYLDLARDRRLTWDVAVLHRAAAIPNYNGHLTTDLDYIVIIGKQAPQKGLEASEYSKLFSLGSWERPVPWAKPAALMVRILKLYSAAGDAVLEPYCGSGTTMIAAEMTGRRCLAIELNPEYVDLTVRRWQLYTKKPATLKATGKTFDQVVRERAKRAA